MKVGVIDYGVGNLGSVMRTLEELRASLVLIKRPMDMQNVDKLILPGVGNFSDCIELLHAGQWVQDLRDQVEVFGKPLLGICVGMQLLATSSTEGSENTSSNSVPGLGFIPGHVKNLRTLGCELPIPHVGWNDVTARNTSSCIFNGIPNGTDFYFVHSYAYVPDDDAHILATTDYGIPITAAIRYGHIWGTQFHPEKSSRAGFRLLRNFIEHPKC